MNNLKFYLKKARKEKWAIGQFNFSTESQLKGVVSAAQNLKSPVILGTSEGESRFFGLEEAVALRNVLRKKTRLPIFLNLDHGKSLDYLEEAIDAGYDMVHFDGSKLPSEENINETKKIVKYARRKGVLVEGEVGMFATDSSKMYQEKFEIKEELLTNPEESVKYIDKSKVLLLAISVGNFHGIEISGQNPRLLLNRLAEIKRTAKDVFLVLHGGSGILEEDIRQAISLGIVKININTEIRLAFTKSLKDYLEENLEEITPYKYLQNSTEAVLKLAEEKMLLFGSNNKI
ncbi:MAG: class II fructose-bisphosphate aldolase [Candidatus Staskawiczbacteria bacterium]|nr:class II fructose-bisphosphate aldolase [Candidatus Staskawiczbacteria bacterium]